jgi:glutamate synthase (NADPH/NADH) large chain
MNLYKKNLEKLIKNNAYSPEFEHDSCGVGFVASLDGKARREVVENGIEALKAVWHRGAVAKDGSGDGAGIHLEISRTFFEEQIQSSGHQYNQKNQLCIGMIFLPRNDYGAQETCRTIVEHELLSNDFNVFCWRQVPVRPKVLGTKANDTRPEIEQVIFNPNTPIDTEDLERKLFTIRKRIEKKITDSQLKDFYISSLSSRSIIYKGMFLAQNLSDFYPDLEDKRFISRFSIFHQRYSTNTFPSWELAQPFRIVAHNGEINTLKGNVSWMKTHEQGIESNLYKNIDDIKPILKSGSSDTACLDSVFELLARSGRELPLVKMMLIPEAWSKRSKILPQNYRDMYNYLNSVIEPWDGPAAIAATDGNWILAANDRNGLRPLRYTITKDKILFVGSETGMVQVHDENIIFRGRVGPGQMIAVQLDKGNYFTDKKIKDHLSKNPIYKKFSQNLIEISKKFSNLNEFNIFEGDILRQKQFVSGITIEELEMILHPMVEDQKEAVGSMGDDTPPAVLSNQFKNLSHFFRQNFSQVTNPPIDSLRENRVMSLNTRIGNLQNILGEDLFNKKSYLLESPVLSNAQFKKLFEVLNEEYSLIDCTYDVEDENTNLKKQLQRIQLEAEGAAREGSKHIILTDEKVSDKKIGIPIILAVGAVQNHLVSKGLRKFVSLNVKSSECLDVHYFAVLIGAGATTVNPYLALDSIYQRWQKKLFNKLTFSECINNYIKAVNDGLLKVMSKLGISVISSYRGGLNFSGLGLSRSLIAEYFPGMFSKISGLGLSGIERMIKLQHSKAFRGNVISLPIGGFYKFRKDGESHANQAVTMHMLQTAVATDNYDLYKKYSKIINEQYPINLRDLLDFNKIKKSISIEEVESVTDIRKRFGSGSMSLGALSKEAHETLAVAMNRIGGASCSGEGGEDAKRAIQKENGDNANSRVKQIASARFGVTAEYLNNCDEIEIKISQGAKPGEGGQLPGFKVTAEIATLRHSTPGVTLISPPPHHDIYSIEDLSQLIYDLKQINPKAKIGVKLVSSTGIGTIAAGVAKAKADVILISGHSGGTGASPQTSIKYAGLPWEIGLAETNQVLTLNGLRHEVILRTDGGIKTGRDVVMAAMLGADDFGIATTSLIAMGCIMVRQCHSNTCPVGICTQDEELRKKFTGTPEKVVNLFTFIAEEVREILAGLGFKSLNEIVGRSDLLRQVNRGSESLDDLDLNPILVQADPGENPRYCIKRERKDVPDSLDKQIIKDSLNLLRSGQKIQLSYAVKNTHRSVGTRLSSLITTEFKNNKFQEDHITIKLKGSAGQSLGAFACKGIRIDVTGDANDYVGKGLSGGTIILRPSLNSNLQTEKNTIIGNTVLYGATSGYLFAAGQAGERFAVRNSGAAAVVEGCGTNGCEYMTGGTAVILGEVGDNFAAGMTGGMAFVYDPEVVFENFLNPTSVASQNIETEYWINFLYNLVKKHADETNSSHAKKIIQQWSLEKDRFVQICPKEMLNKLKYPITNKVHLKDQAS